MVVNSAERKKDKHGEKEWAKGREKPRELSSAIFIKGLWEDKHSVLIPFKKVDLPFKATTAKPKTAGNFCSRKSGISEDLCSYRNTENQEEREE